MDPDCTHKSRGGSGKLIDSVNGGVILIKPLCWIYTGFSLPLSGGGRMLYYVRHHDWLAISDIKTFFPSEAYKGKMLFHTLQCGTDCVNTFSIKTSKTRFYKLPAARFSQKKFLFYKYPFLNFFEKTSKKCQNAETLRKIRNCKQKLQAEIDIF